MLQRIQTVYLLIIVVLTVATLFLPLAVLQQGDALFSFDASGLSTMIGEPELLYKRVRGIEKLQNEEPTKDDR